MGTALSYCPRTTCDGLGESGASKHLYLPPFLCPGHCCGPCAPRPPCCPGLGPLHCVAEDHLWIAPSLCPLCKACLCCPGTSSGAVWSWRGLWAMDVVVDEDCSGRQAGKNPLYGSRRAGAGRAMVDLGAPGRGTGWGTGCSAKEGSLHERGTPRAGPSADCWDWPLCTPGQRSSGRGLGNLTRRDWSSLGRHHCDVNVG